MMPLINAQNIEIRHGATRAVFGVTLAIQAGEIVTIVGPNGSGKSTLLRALIGALAPSKGTITRAPNLRVGYVPQKLHIDPTLPMTVRRFLNLPVRVSVAKMRTALARTGVDAFEKRQLSALSGGQLQRVLLARAILNDPQILVLDEATQGLDQPASAAFYRLIETLRDDIGCAVLMVSHELHVVMSATDRVTCLARARVALWRCIATTMTTVTTMTTTLNMTTHTRPQIDRPPRRFHGPRDPCRHGNRAGLRRFGLFCRLATHGVFWRRDSARRDPWRGPGVAVFGVGPAGRPYRCAGDGVACRGVVRPHDHT
jgi:zinc transport system ATP-binding protein